MRIIAGTFRGRVLASPRDRSVRPTTDRVKQSIFDILATLVDSPHASLSLLEKNIQLLGLENRTAVHQAEVFWFLKNSRHPYGLVFVDPPFALERIGLP